MSNGRGIINNIQRGTKKATYAFRDWYYDLSPNAQVAFDGFLFLGTVLIAWAILAALGA